MTYINYLLNPIFDIFFSPFKSVGPLYGLIAISLLTALIALPIFKLTSNQKGIKRAKSRIMGYLLEVRLFKDNIRTVFSAQKNILKYNLIYFKYTLKPLLFMIIPIAVIIIQTGLRFEHRPLKPGESTIVKIKMKSENYKNALLFASDGIEVETPPLRVDRNGETYWRIKINSEGEHTLRAKTHNSEIRLTILVADKVVSISSKIVKESFINSFIYPNSAILIGNSIIESLEIKYPYRNIKVFGFTVHWLIIYFIITLLFSFILAKPFNVRI